MKIRENLIQKNINLYKLEQNIPNSQIQDLEIQLTQHFKK